MISIGEKATNTSNVQNAGLAKRRFVNAVVEALHAVP
jgi:hypothetical protein